MAKKLNIFLIFLSVITLSISAQSELRSSPQRGGPPEGGGNMQPPSSSIDSSKIDSTNTPYYFMVRPDNLDTFRIPFDTIFHGVHVYSQMYKKSISNTTLGNLGSPYISNIYFDRPEVEFLFTDVYDAYRRDYNNIPHLNTKTPFTLLTYNNGGPKKYAEDYVAVFFSQNINKDQNLGFYYDLVYGRGRYTSQSTRHKNYGGFYSYNSERYNAYFNIGSCVMENYENGGFGTATEWDDTYVTEPSEGVSSLAQNFDVRIDEAESKMTTRFITFKQNYNLGVIRMVEKEDTVENVFVSAINIVHQFKYETNVKRYEDDDVVTTYYDTAYINSDLTIDSVRRRRISNRIGIYLDEGINRYGKFGAGAYIQMDNDYITNDCWASIEDSSMNKGYRGMINDDDDYVVNYSRYFYMDRYNGYKYTNVKFGGSMFKREGTHFFYDASGEIYLSGYNLGDWRFKGVMREVFPRWGKMEISGRADFSRKTPDYVLQHYHANNFWWDNSFDAEFSQQLGGTLSIPSINLKLSLDVDNMQNKIYFNENALPQQYSNNLAVMAFRVEKTFEFGKHLAWENNIVYQETSSDAVIPLPEFTIYTNLYTRFVYAKVLNVELGVDCRYYTSYYAPGYMPATGRYYNQREVKIGNYPLIDLYADFFLKRMRFFVMWQHVNQGWPRWEYFSAPHYAYNPRMVKFGLQWTFYD